MTTSLLHLTETFLYHAAEEKTWKEYEQHRIAPRALAVQSRAFMFLFFFFEESELPRKEKINI